MTFATKLAYGAGDAGAAITSIMLLSYLSPFLTDVAHLSPGLAGQSQLVGKIWDAVNDPMVNVFAVVVALCVYLGTDSESRTHRRWKRAIRKYGVLAVATAFAFAGSVVDDSPTSVEPMVPTKAPMATLPARISCLVPCWRSMA